MTRTSPLPTSAALVAEPLSWVSRTYRVAEPSGASAGELKLHWGRERATFRDAAGEARLFRDGFAGPFLMKRAGRRVASAEKPSFWRRAFEVRHDGERYELRARGLGRTFEVLSGGRRVGQVRPVSCLSRRARLEAAKELPVELGVFLLWLTLVLWKRNEQAAVAGGA